MLLEKTKHRKYLEFILVPIIILTLGIWTMPGLLESPTFGLDPSWRIGLNMAMMKNFQFGRDIVFTSGPLGYIVQPTFVDFTLWAISSSFTVIIHFLFLSTMAM